MLETFIASSREAFQCSFIITLLLLYPELKNRPGYVRSLVAGVASAFIAGFAVGYLPALGPNVIGNETWVFWRLFFDSLVFYISVFMAITSPGFSGRPLSAALCLLGFSAFFFEARALGFLARDIGIMQEKVAGTALAGISGAVLGFVPLFCVKGILNRIPVEKAFTSASLVMTFGALRFMLGGVSELEKGNIVSELQRGILVFMEAAVRKLQAALLMSGHAFIKVPFAALADFIAGDRTALTLTVIFIMTPPLFILLTLFARPDPLLHDLEAGAQKRREISFFRKDLVNHSIPALSVFIMLTVMLHEGNMAMNPLYDPPPSPVRELEGEKVVRVPFSDISDKKLKKYVYYQILFLIALKPDGTAGVALDQCEICRPAKWNKDALGYAQKGENLICKYCMTPIAMHTLNNPGGCNPIPVPFKLEDGQIVIEVEELITTYKKAEALEKKGTHL
ncbi:MAG: DUF2318 domain-containing protein [Nitrospirae bacterium]|nr:MAG: DUF2318 domain-containing protein [Nitrospirota bacterium]